MRALPRIIGNRAALGGSAFTVSYISTGAEGEGTSNPSIPYPASPLAGDMLVLFVANRGSATTIPTPSGWTSGSSRTGGAGSDATDSGVIRLSIFYKIADGTESGSLSITAATTSYDVAMRLYRKSGGTWSVDVQTAANNTAGVGWVAQASANRDTVANDVWVVVSGINSDDNTAAPIGSTVQVGSTRSLGNGVIYTTSAGNNLSLYMADATFIASSNGDPTHQAEYATSTANTPAGVTGFVRLRAS